MLCRDGMGGFGGLTLREYDATPDHVLRDSYFAAFDEDHQLIPWRKRTRQNKGEVSGSPARAGRELPTREALHIPEEAWQVNPLLSMTPSGQRYVLMWWQTWRRRQAEGVRDEQGQSLTDDYLMKRFCDKVDPKRNPLTEKAAD